MQYTTINDIIFQCYSDLGRSATEEDHKRYFAWIVRGYKNLNLCTLPLDKAVTLDVKTGIRCVVIPDDYVSFVAIGRDTENHFEKFVSKPDLMPNTTEGCFTITQTDTLPTKDLYGGYAVGGGRGRWYYRLDEGNNRILIDGDILTEATLVYKSTGIDMNGETFIPKLAEEALIAWVHYQQALGDKDKGMIVLRKQIFDDAVRDIQHSQFNLDALMDAVYSTIYQGVKR